MSKGFSTLEPKPGTVRQTDMWLLLESVVIEVISDWKPETLMMDYSDEGN